MRFRQKATHHVDPSVLTFGADLLMLKLLISALFGSSLSSLSREAAMAAKNEIGDRINVVLAGLTNAEFKAQVEVSALTIMALIDTAEEDLRKRVGEQAG